MAKFEDFVREWYVTEWKVGGDKGPIPSDGFARGSLAIVAPIAQLPDAPKVVNLYWKDESGRGCELLGLSFWEEHGMLHDPKIPVSFGGLLRPIMAAVTLFITDAGVLQGELKYSRFAPPLDGNTGTFAADAEPPRDDRRGGRARGRSGRMAPRQEGEHERIRGAVSGA